MMEPRTTVNGTAKRREKQTWHKSISKQDTYFSVNLVPFEQNVVSTAVFPYCLCENIARSTTMSEAMVTRLPRGSGAWKEAILINLKLEDETF